MIGLNSKLAFRNYLKNREYTIINITGLAVGLAAFIMISLFIQFHLSFDKNNKNFKNIYRLDQKANLSGSKETYPCSPFPLGAKLKQDYPDIINYARVKYCREFLSSDKEHTSYEDIGIYADYSLFDIFDYEFVKGNPKNALKEPLSIVLTEKLAKKYFPGKDPMGKSINFMYGHKCTITGIIKRQPENSLYVPDYIVSFSTLKSTLEPNIEENWDWSMASTFLLLRENTNVNDLNKKINSLLDTYHPNINNNKLQLWPLSKIHLQYVEERNSRNYVFLFGMIALFILVIACINFMNLSTAYSSVRIKEVGLRKIAGATRHIIIRQFLGEALLISIISLVFALALSELVLPFLNAIIEGHLAMNFMKNYLFFIFILLITIATGVILGSYPAFYLSSLLPVNTLKGNLKTASKNPLLRKILVVLQFTISIILIICTISIIKQLNYMKGISLGFDRKNILVGYLQLNGKNNIAQYNALKANLLKDPRIVNVCWSHNAPYFDMEWWEVNIEGRPKEQRFRIDHNHVDYDFMKTYGIKLKEGRELSPSDKQDACLINEEAVKKFGWNNKPLGKKIINDKHFEYTVIGVMNNFHTYSVTGLIEPYFLSYSNRQLSWPNTHSVKIATHQNINEMKKYITKKFQEYFPDDYIEFNLLDTHLDQDNYGFVEMLGTLIGFFAFLAIVISAIGLFGLVSFITKQRTKEIGIRKANGAVISNIFKLIIKEFIIILIIANVIAIPLAYHISTRILQNFAYHIHINCTIYLMAALLSLIIMLITVSYHVLKITYANPIDALRYE